MSKIDYKGYRIKIKQDNDPENPREAFDNIGKMICFHSKYSLGDEHNYKDFDQLLMELAGDVLTDDEQGSYYDDLSKEVLQKLTDRLHETHVILSIYLYDHSGTTVSTQPFSCSWDSCKVGVIFAPKSIVFKEFYPIGILYGLHTKMVKYLPGGKYEYPPELKVEFQKLKLALDNKEWIPEFEDYLEHVLKQEVKTYDQFLTGDIHGFIVKDRDGDELDSCWGFFGEKNAIEAAKEQIDWLVENPPKPKDTVIKIVLNIAHEDKIDAIVNFKRITELPDINNCLGLKGAILDAITTLEIPDPENFTNDFCSYKRKRYWEIRYGDKLEGIEDIPSSNIERRIVELTTYQNGNPPLVRYEDLVIVFINGDERKKMGVRNFISYHYSNLTEGSQKELWDRYLGMVNGVNNNGK